MRARARAPRRRRSCRECVTRAEPPQELAAKEEAVGLLRERQAILERECASKDDEMLVLTEQLHASRMELKVCAISGSRARRPAAAPRHAHISPPGGRRRARRAQ